MHFEMVFNNNNNALIKQTLKYIIQVGIRTYIYLFVRLQSYQMPFPLHSFALKSCTLNHYTLDFSKSHYYNSCKKNLFTILNTQYDVQAYPRLASIYIIYLRSVHCLSFIIYCYLFTTF